DPRSYTVRKAVPVSASAARADEAPQPDPLIQPSTEAIPDPPEPLPRLDATTLNVQSPFPWPVNPQDSWHEVAGVVGEARGNFSGTALDHLHAGLDVRGVMGEPCLSVYDEKVSSPLPTWGFDDSGEGVSVGAFSYIHIRVGRNAAGAVQDGKKFRP